MKMKSRGFTLIELLIVIALLGALAVGLIGAIDPFEQLKKGTDTGRRDLVNQVQTAFIRYYSVKNQMPFAADPTSIDLKTTPVKEAIVNVQSAGELRSDFQTIQAGNLDQIWVTGTGAPGTTDEQPTVSVCYLPGSKSFQSDVNTKYNKDGSLADANTCKSAKADGVDCYWCIQ